MEQLQKLALVVDFSKTVTFGMDLLHLVEILHIFTIRFPVHIVVKHLQTMVVASRGQVCTTTLKVDMPIWQIQTAARTSVWWLQNKTKPFQAICTVVSTLS
jgi:hypothetical protein